MNISLSSGQRTVAFASGAILVTALVWVGMAKWSNHCHPDLGNRALYGDSFGFSNSLFSALAFAGLIVTLQLQMQELRLQRQEVKATREELRRAAQAQEATEKHLALSSYLSGLDTLIEFHRAESLQEKNSRFAPSTVLVQSSMGKLRAAVEQMGGFSGVSWIRSESSRCRFLLAGLDCAVKRGGNSSVAETKSALRTFFSSLHSPQHTSISDVEWNHVREVYKEYTADLNECVRVLDDEPLSVVAEVKHAREVGTQKLSDDFCARIDSAMKQVLAGSLILDGWDPELIRATSGTASPAN